jgi:hypothetical protein
LNRPGLVKGGFAQRRVSLGVDLTVVVFFGFGFGFGFGFDRSEISDRGVQPVLGEPVDPGEGREFEVVALVR